MSSLALEPGAKKGPAFSSGQELANAITHGAGALLAVSGAVILVVQAALRGDIWQLVSFSVFGASMVLLYTASSVYHALTAARAKRVFEILDHAAIFVLIAGTYTAFCLTLLRGGVGWWLFGAVWLIAAAGIVVEAVFLNRWPLLSLAAYLAMGWIVVLAWKPLRAVANPTTLALVIAGGLAYTAGTVFYALGKKRGWFHPLWHLFVVAGTACHFFAILASLPPAA